MSDLDEAKRWFEAATVIVRYVQNGKQKAQQVTSSLFFILDSEFLTQWIVGGGVLSPPACSVWRSASVKFEM